MSDDTILVAERAGQIRVVRNGVLDPQPVSGGPTVRAQGLSGMDLALHPDFDRNHYVYISYTKPLDEKRTTLAVARAVWDGRALTGTTDVFVGEGGGGGPIAFGGDGMLYIASGGGGENATQNREQPRRQDPAAHRYRCSAARQSVRRAHRRQTRGLHDGPPQHAAHGHASRHRRHLAGRDGAERRRRSEHPRARRQLRLAARQSRAHLRRSVAGAVHEGRVSRPGHLLDAVDRDVEHRLLHGRPAAQMEGRYLRRRDALRGDSGHGTDRADPDQQESRRAAAGAAARRSASADSRREAGAGRPVVPAHRR